MIESRLENLVKTSKASEEFKRAVVELAQGNNSTLIRYSPGSPKIKVLRVLMKLLDEYPDEQITEVDIRGSSSCSAYAGMLTFGPQNRKIAFSWNCEWKARQEGFKTWYGAPDQIKAAHLFGYQCFEKFEAI